MAEVNEREAVKAAYTGINWRKVVAKMSDEQVTAIYLRLKAKGKL